MMYRATIINHGVTLTRVFPSMFEAAQWLDSENNNLEATTMIEVFDETGRKTEGFFYTEKAK